MLGVLDKTANHSVEAVLAWLWDLYEQYGRDQSPLENAQTIFLVCCKNDDERQKSLDQFQVVRAECYRLIALKNVSSSHQKSHFDHVNQRDTGAPSAYNLCDGELSFNIFMQALQNDRECIEWFAQLHQNRIEEYKQS